MLYEVITSIHYTKLYEAAATLRYAAIGYRDRDPEAMHEMIVRNYDFFGAPVGSYNFV